MDFQHESQFSLVVNTNEQAFAEVCAALEAAGAVEVLREYGMAGSQEIGYRTYQLRGRDFVVQAETYLSVTLFGPRDLVEELAARVKASMSRT